MTATTLDDVISAAADCLKIALAEAEKASGHLEK